MIKLARLGSLCLFLITVLFPASALAQLPDDYIFLDNNPSYIDSWTGHTDNGIGWYQYDEISLDATEVLDAIDSYGEILLPGKFKYDSWGSANSSTNGRAFRRYKLVDRWESTVYDGSIGGAGANRTYEVATLQGPHNSIAAVVVDPVRYLIVLPFEDWFEGSDRSQCYYIMGEHGSTGSFGRFTHALESQVVPGNSPSPVPFSASESCETSANDEDSNLLPPSTNQMPPADIQDISYIRTSISYALAVENMLNALPIDIPASMWSSAFSALANGILIDELGVLLRHEWVQPTGNEIPVTADSSIFNPDTMGSWDPVFNFEDELFAMETNLMASVLDFEGVHCGQMFLYGGGGVVYGDACTNEKFRGVTRIDQLFDPFDLRTYVHEFSHQFNVMHTFNANQNKENDLSATQRLTTSAYEPGSGGTIMSYTHNCSEYYTVVTDPETGALDTLGGNHQVKHLMKTRTKNNRFWPGFGELRDIFHTHSVEQMQDYLAAACPTVVHTPTVAPTPSIEYEWGIGDVAETKYVPIGIPFVLSVVPEEHTSYRWHQMDLGPMHTQPDWKAMNTIGGSPRIMADGPTPDGKRFFPPRDNLFDDVNINYQYVPFVENELVSMSFRVQANRFIPKADLSDSDAASAPYHNSISTGDDINVVGLVISMDFGITSGPWDDNGGQLWATQEIGEPEPFYQGVMTWNVDGTDQLPWEASTVEVVLVTETIPLQYEVLYTGVPNTGESASLVLNLSPPDPMDNGDIPEQRILIRPEGEIFFALSPPFQVYHAGCTNNAFASYDPHANYHDQSQCDLDGIPDDFYSFMCKDIDACNYSQTAHSHDPEDCLYPDCNQLGALNFSFYVGANFPGNEPSSGYCIDGPCVFDAVSCEGDWMDPSGSGMAWGFAHSYAPEEWFLNEFPHGMWSEFNDLTIYDTPYTADIQVSEVAGRFHFTAGTPDNNGLSLYQSASVEIASTGMVEFDWQITESVNAGFSNLAFYLDGEPIEFDKGPNWSTMWLVGDDTAPFEGSVSFEANVGQTFRVALTTSVHQTHPIGVILSDFKYTKHSIEGCLNPDALNFNPFATCHNAELCHDATSFDSEAACLDVDACNFAGYGATGFHHPLLCQFPGCDDPNAANFDPFAGCMGPCCYAGDCDFELDEGTSSPVLWFDWNEVWEEIDPLPDFEEVMFLPGGMVLTAPQTTTPGISQSVRYTYNGTGAAPMSFLFSWVPGEMSIPGEMYSPAVMEVWKEGVLVQEISLSPTAGSPVDFSSDVVAQSYAIPPSQWPGDPFGLSPFVEDGAMLIQSEPVMGTEHYFRMIQTELTEQTEIIFKMYGDLEDLVLDDAPCRLLISGMSLPQNAECNVLSGPLSLGCTDVLACNFDPAAIVDNGSCLPVGCTDPEAMNYNPDAGCQSTCLYPGDCSNPVSVNASVAAGFVGAFGAGEVELSMPEEQLIFTEHLVTIVGPDESIGSTPFAPGDHSIFWVAEEAIDVQFAYAVASWDGGINFDFPYYQINSQPYSLLDEVNGDDPETAYWMVNNEEWQPAADLMLPNPSEVPYPAFEDNLVFPVRVLKTPIPLNAGDTLRIGVESDDNVYGEVVLALAGMVWTNHCTEDFEDPWILGCNEPEACNYNPYADEDDGSCMFPGMLCDDGDVCTFDDQYNEACECAGFFLDSDDDGTCDVEDECPDNPDLSEEGVCGCETPVDANGNSIFDCLEFCDLDTDEDGICDENEVPGCTDELACNYNASASDDDGSCSFSGPDCACAFNVAFATDTLPTGQSITVTSFQSMIGGLDSVYIDLYFTPDLLNYAGDLLVGICAPNGNCVEVGGYNIGLGYPDGGGFPGSWSSEAFGTYTMGFNLEAFDLAGEGNWTIELQNDYGPGASAMWEGTIVFSGVCGAPIVGCLDEEADNYDSEATESGPCYYLGCKEPAACNYDPQANVDDGSCLFPGDLCMMPGPCNSEGYLDENCECQFDGPGDANGDGICDDVIIPGCTDELACNYNPEATADDGSCETQVWMIPEVLGSGPAILGCENDLPEGYIVGDFLCVQTVVDNDSYCMTNAWDSICYNAYLDCLESSAGCNDSLACNFGSSTEDCIYPGDPCYELGPCYPDALYTADCGCDGMFADADEDGFCAAEDCDEGNPLIPANGSCDDLWGCTDITSCNYDESVTADDGSCIEPDYWLIPAFEQPGPALPWCGSLDDLPIGYIVGDFYCVDQVVDTYYSCVEYAWNSFGGGAFEYCEDSYIDCQAAAGCMDATACNYEETATEDDGSCLYPGALCAEATACALEAYYDEDCGCNPEPLGIDTDGDGICDEDEVAGCTNDLACNYNPSATDSDGSCYFVGELCDWGVPSCSGNLNTINEFCECVPDVPDTDGDGVCDEDEIAGCQDPTALNYEPAATDDDGSCEYDNGWEEIYGCTDSAACNFYPGATMDDGSCAYPQAGYDCQGTCLEDADNDGVCDEDEVPGCTDASATNYDPTATDEDGSCDYGNEEVFGCTDPSANNYDPTATIDDGSCSYDETDVYGCTDPDAVNYDPAATLDDGSCDYDYVDESGCTDPSAINYNPDATIDSNCCVYEITNAPGCTDTSALNFNPLATYDDGSCNYEFFYGCMDQAACNYNPLATYDGGCEYDDEVYDCENNCWSDADGDGICDPLEVPGCTDTVACNWNPLATDDDGSCTYPELGYDCNGECTFDADGDGTCDADDGCPADPSKTDPGVCGCGVVDIDSDGDGYFDCEEDCDYDPFKIEPGECGCGVSDSDMDGDGVSDCNEVSGCTDIVACNFNPFASDDDASCLYPDVGYDCEGNGVIYGCTDPTAWNYNEYATSDDFSCVYAGATGCTDVDACNFDSGAEVENGTCTYPLYPWLDCNGDCINDSDEDGLCDELEIYGCTDPTAWNYNEYATSDDYSCVYAGATGCTDVDACNFDSGAEVENGTCTYPLYPWLDCNGDCIYDSDEDGLCDELEIYGCTDPTAWNYNEYATSDDYSCVYAGATGCTDVDACNFDSGAEVENGTCTYPLYPWLDCNGDCINDSDEDGLCDELEIYGCTDPLAWNYNEYATSDDYSCVYAGATGCTDVDACNFDSGAEVENGTCTYPLYPWLDCNGDCINDTDEDGVCDVQEVAGCTDPLALNYGDWATDDDGSCAYALAPGCTYPDALNYNTEADYDDGSCEFAAGPNPCPADLDQDGTVAVSDLLLLLSSYGSECE